MDDNEELHDPTSPWSADAITLHNFWIELQAAGFSEHHATYLSGVFLRALVQSGKPS
jgi:hypothetical protein